MVRNGFFALDRIFSRAGYASLCQRCSLSADFFFKIMDQIGYGPSLPFKHYLGYWNGEAVACSSLFLGAGVAGLYNVATLPEVRGKGLGTAISARTLKEGHLRGYRTGILHATSMGLPVYQRLGFKEYCRIQIYLLSRTSDQGFHGLSQIDKPSRFLII